MMTHSFAAAVLLAAGLAAPQSFVTYEPVPGPGSAAGKRVVLIAADEEYRQEEALPMLARILAFRHGFRASVLFSQDKATGLINPDVLDHIPGLDQLADADLLVLGIRFRELPDADMAKVIQYMQSGRPIIGLRTSTHAFSYAKNPGNPYARYSYQSRDPAGGFGRLVLGTTWAGHHGIFNVRSTQARIREARKAHPILRGVRDFWAPSDVYKTDPLPPDAMVLMDGQVLSGMRPGDAPVSGMATQPVIWTREYRNEKGNDQRVVAMTTAAGVDFKSPDLRRLFVNACYWSVGREALIPEAANVDIFGAFEPATWGGGNYRKGLRPSDWNMATPVTIGPGKGPGNGIRYLAGHNAIPGAIPGGSRFRADGKSTTQGGRLWFPAEKSFP